MAEINVARIKSVYGEIKGYYDNLPEIPQNGSSYILDVDTANNFNSMVDRLSALTLSDLSHNKADIGDQWYRRLDVKPIKMKMGSILSRLEADYGFSPQAQSNQPAIAIFNKNENNIDININFTIENLIESAASKEEKDNLQIIQEELKKPSANWDKLKASLSWIFNYSKELSLKVIPLILEYYLKKN